jgi:hypothetical protein
MNSAKRANPNDRGSGLYRRVSAARRRIDRASADTRVRGTSLSKHAQALGSGWWRVHPLLACAVGGGVLASKLQRQHWFLIPPDEPWISDRPATEQLESLVGVISSITASPTVVDCPPSAWATAAAFREPSKLNLPLNCYRSKYLNNVQPQLEVSSRPNFIISACVLDLGLAHSILMEMWATNRIQYQANQKLLEIRYPSTLRNVCHKPCG